MEPRVLGDEAEALGTPRVGRGAAEHANAAGARLDQSR